MSVQFKGKIYKVKKKKGFFTLDLTAKGITDIREIKGLENLSRLQILKLSDNKIFEISGLENLKSLQKLYLFGNEISEIKNIDNLENLQELYLNNNKIKEIKGIRNLGKIKLINLNNNLITKSEALNELQSLMLLSIYGNPIFRYAEEQFGLILSPNKATKYCGKLNIDYIKDFIKKLSLAHKKIKFDTISSQTGMKSQYLKLFVEEMIINKEINARIKEDFLSFNKEDIKYLSEETGEIHYIKNVGQPIDIKCKNCSEILHLTAEMLTKSSIVCKTCGIEIKLQKDFNHV